MNQDHVEDSKPPWKHHTFPSDLAAWPSVKWIHIDSPDYIFWPPTTAQFATDIGNWTQKVRIHHRRLKLERIVFSSAYENDQRVEGTQWEDHCYIPNNSKQSISNGGFCCITSDGNGGPWDLGGDEECYTPSTSEASIDLIVGHDRFYKLC